MIHPELQISFEFRRNTSPIVPPNSLTISVRMGGLEPPRCYPLVPETSASRRRAGLEVPGPVADRPEREVRAVVLQTTAHGVQVPEHRRIPARYGNAENRRESQDKPEGVLMVSSLGLDSARFRVTLSIMTANMNTATCSCGESAPHVIARRETADGIGVEIWHDGVVTGRLGRALPGVTIVRPRTAKALDAAQRAASLIESDISMYGADELSRVYACARKVAARGGSRRDLCVALAERDRPALAFSWVTYTTDSTGAVTCRVARLDRIRWPGLAVWHERGKYELLAVTHGVVPGARSREALEPMGISFSSQRGLIEHLLSVARPLTGASL